MMAFDFNTLDPRNQISSEGSLLEQRRKRLTNPLDPNAPAQLSLAQTSQPTTAAEAIEGLPKAGAATAVDSLDDLPKELETPPRLPDVQPQVARFGTYGQHPAFGTEAEKPMLEKTEQAAQEAYSPNVTRFGFMRSQEIDPETGRPKVVPGSLELKGYTQERPPVEAVPPTPGTAPAPTQAGTSAVVGELPTKPVATLPYPVPPGQAVPPGAINQEPGMSPVGTQLPAPTGHAATGELTLDEEARARRYDAERAQMLQQQAMEDHPPSLGRKILAGIAAVPISKVSGMNPVDAYNLVAEAPGREAAKPYTQQLQRFATQQPLLQQEATMGKTEAEAAAAPYSAAGTYMRGEAELRKAMQGPGVDVNKLADGRLLITSKANGERLWVGGPQELKGIPGGEALFQGSQYLGQTPTDKSKLDPKQRYMQSVIDSEQSRSMRSTGQPLSDDQLARLNHDLMINMQEIDKIGTKEDTGSGSILTNQLASGAYDSLDKITDTIKPGTTGLAGWAASKVPGTPAYSLRTNIEQAQSQIELYVMSSLKQISGSGSTGFGQLSEKEGQVMQDAFGTLRQAQSPEEIKAAITNIQASLRRFQKIVGDFNEEQKAKRSNIPSVTGAGAPAPAAGAAPSGAGPQPGNIVVSEGKRYRVKGIRPDGQIDADPI
jgi:hypothetical protein